MIEQIIVTDGVTEHTIEGEDLEKFREALDPSLKGTQRVLEFVANDGRRWFINKYASREEFRKLPAMVQWDLKEAGYFIWS